MEKQILLENSRISGFADEIAVDMDTQIALLKELGIGWVEFRSGDGKGVADYSLEEAKDLRRKLDENGIRVSALGSPIGKIGIEEDFAPHLKLLEHLTELAGVLGTSYIRMFSFFIPVGKDPADYRDEVFGRTKAMVEMAKEKGVVLLHENEKGIYGDVAQRCLDLMQNFYGEHYRCTFDFANFVQCGQDVLAAYEMLKPYITYVHVKDAVMETGEVTPAGEGDGHVAEILRRLDGEGYKGFLSLEPHLVDFAGLKNLEKDAKERKRSDGEQAFSQAYHALRKILG